MATRIWALVALELKSAWRRPLWWVLLSVLFLLTWGLTAGNVQISSGGSSANTQRLWSNSQFNLAFYDILIFTLTYLFFVSVAFGNALIDDEEHRVGPLLNGTRLTVAEYALGRWLGVAAIACIVMALHLLIQVGFQTLYPVEEPEKVRDPVFTLWNYVRPFALFIGLPVLCLGAFTFAVGSVTRHAVFVFMTPVLVLLVCTFLLWNYNPSWLPNWVNDILCIVDVTGFRWLNITWLEADRGADFYNKTPLGLDGILVLNRLVLVGGALVSLAVTVRVLGRRLRHPFPVTQEEQQAAVRAADAQAATVKTDNVRVDEGLSALAMTHARPSWLSTFLVQARAEAKELRRSPGLWIFVPLIGLELIGTSFFVPGWFETPKLITSGSVVATGFNTVTLLSLFLLLFYTTESMARDDRRRIWAIVDSSGVASSARLLGKLAANIAVVLLSVLVVLYVELAIGQLIQLALLPSKENAPLPTLVPFLQVWPVFLLPTVVAWMGMIALVWSITRSRYAVYACGLGILILTGILWVNGWINWVFNWHFWNGVTWTDFGSFQLDRGALLMNRLAWLLVGLLLIQVALLVERRRVPDPTGIASRARWWPLCKAVAKTLPLAVPAAALLIALAFGVYFGSAGAVRTRIDKAYRAANAETWRNFKDAAIKHMELDVRIDPRDSSFSVKGSYELVNPHDTPMDRFALTPGPHYKDLKFTFQGAEHTPDSAAAARRNKRAILPVEDSAGLWIFRTEKPLNKGETTTVGFEYHGHYPSGMGRSTRGASEYILPSGVVLNAFGRSFLPMIGWQDGVGVDPEDGTEPRRPDPDEWKKQTKPGLGSGSTMTASLRVSVPEEYRANAPGVLQGETINDGWRTMTWVTDQPVRFYNIVAGKWMESKGERTSIWHLPEHRANVPTMLRALDGAHQWFSEWFYPYPFKELRLSEFPGLADYAQGFGTNIVFSESIGFLSRPSEEMDPPFWIVAHEAAHQWWGNVLMPGDGPGGNILSEGLAHYSAARLLQKLGSGTDNNPERAVQAFLRYIEKSYVERRVADEERPLVEIDGMRNGDTSVTYDKGGWVFWMLHDLMGQKASDAGMHDFIVRFKDGPDYPLLQDFVQVMREHAPDKDAYDAFVKQWFFDVVLPDLQLVNARAEKNADGTWTTHATVKNAGTGTVAVEVAATNGVDRWPGAGSDKTYEDARATVTLAAGQEATVDIKTAWEPQKILIDPDVRVLQMSRKKAEGNITR